MFLKTSLCTYLISMSGLPIKLLSDICSCSVLSDTEHRYTWTVSTDVKSRLQCLAAKVKPGAIRPTTLNYVFHISQKRNNQYNFLKWNFNDDTILKRLVHIHIYFNKWSVFGFTTLCSNVMIEGLQNGVCEATNISMCAKSKQATFFLM